MMVLPVRIELTASPLPRECSTTELRQPVQTRAETCHRRGIEATLGLDACHEHLKIFPMKPKQTSAEVRKARLAKALKANLGRRKARAKALKKPPERAGD